MSDPFVSPNATEHASGGVEIGSLYRQHERERYALYARCMNEMMVRMLHAIDYDVRFQSRAGQYLFDQAGPRYLDLLSGWGASSASAAIIPNFARF